MYQVGNLVKELSDKHGHATGEPYANSSGNCAKNTII